MQKREPCSEYRPPVHAKHTA